MTYGIWPGPRGAFYYIANGIYVRRGKWISFDDIVWC